MEKKKIIFQNAGKPKLLLVLPILTLPFITVLFWLLGGGTIEAINTKLDLDEGFNVQLPNPNFTEASSFDKMSYYEAAKLDSIKMDEMIKKDPNYNYQNEVYLEDDTIGVSENYEAVEKSFQKKGGLNTNIVPNPNEAKVYAKLEALQKVMNQSENPHPMSKTKQYEDATTSIIHSKDVDRLEQMMESMNQPQEDDPELQKLNGMLENILDIQHPDRVKEKIRKQSELNKGEVFSVNSMPETTIISALENHKKNSEVNSGMRSNSFYSLDNSYDEPMVQNAIKAVIHETQTLVSGSTVKLRLDQAVFINGVLVPKDVFLFGTASLRGERLLLSIPTIRYNNSIFPVDLAVYDMDGIEGIYIPGSISREVAKSSADRSVQTMGVTSLDDSWGAQAAEMGIEAAKNLLSKKVKLIKVTIKAGYQVLIRDEKQKREASN